MFGGIMVYTCDNMRAAGIIWFCGSLAILFSQLMLLLHVFSKPQLDIKIVNIGSSSLLRINDSNTAVIPPFILTDTSSNSQGFHI